MTETIALTDTRIEYIPIAAARKLQGLRLILGAYAIPGPWREACKGLFYVKGLSYTAVATSDEPEPGADLRMGMQESARELRAWTGQDSAPVAIWNDERPRSSWIDQVNLAERLAPQPSLVPGDIEDRIRMFGLINELAGEHGFGWSARLAIIHGGLSTLAPGAEGRAFFEHLADKYGYNESEGAAAPRHMADTIRSFEPRPKRQPSQVVPSS